MAKHSKSTSNYGLQSKREKVERWLRLEDLQMTEMHDSRATWVIEAKARNGVGFVIIQESAMPNRLMIQTSVNVSTTDRARIGAMEADERKNFVWDLRLGLLQMNVDFTGVAEPLELILIRRTIYDDALTNDAFIQRLKEVNSATWFVIWTVSRQRSSPPVDEDHTEDFLVH